MKLNFKLAKQSFFNTQKVVKSMRAAKRKALSRAGAFVRQRARTSMKKVGKRQKKDIKERLRRGEPIGYYEGISRPGQPPFDHGGPLRQLLFFAWDDTSQSTVIGPVLFGQVKSAGQSPRAPETLEFGGAVSAVTKYGDRRSFRYQARPFMNPALLAEVQAGTIPKQFHNSLGGLS